MTGPSADNTGSVSGQVDNGGVVFGNSGVVRDVTINLGGGLTPDNLGSLHPHYVASLLSTMDTHRAAMLLTAAELSVAAEVTALLAPDRAIEIITANVIHPARTRELIACLPPAMGSLLNDALIAAVAITECWEKHRSSLGELRSPLGVAAVSRHGGAGLRRQCTNGRVYWTATTGAVPIWHGIADYHGRRGGSSGRLGYPTTPEITAAKSPQGTAGVYQRFEYRFPYPAEVREPAGGDYGATVYWSAAYGPRATWGGIGEHYERLGGTWGLGFPISGEQVVKADDTVERCRQDFEGGTIFWSEADNVSIVVTPDLLAVAEGAHRAFPVSAASDLVAGSGTTAVAQAFEHPGRSDTRVMVYSSSHGVIAVSGLILAAHEASGGAGGSLGLPVAPIDPYGGSGMDCSQTFEGGRIYTRDDRTYVVGGPILRVLADSVVATRLGFPTGDADTLQRGGETVQMFEGGVVVVAGDAVRVWTAAEPGERP